MKKCCFFVHFCSRNGLRISKITHFHTLLCQHQQQWRFNYSGDGTKKLLPKINGTQRKYLCFCRYFCLFILCFHWSGFLIFCKIETKLIGTTLWSTETKTASVCQWLVNIFEKREQPVHSTTLMNNCKLFSIEIDTEFWKYRYI